MKYHLSFLNYFFTKHISHFRIVFEADDLDAAIAKTEGFIELNVGQYMRFYDEIAFDGFQWSPGKMIVTATVILNGQTHHVARACLNFLGVHEINKVASEKGEDTIEGDLLVRDILLSQHAGVPKEVYLKRITEQYDLWVIEEANRRILDSRKEKSDLDALKNDMPLPTV